MKANKMLHKLSDFNLKAKFNNKKIYYLKMRQLMNIFFRNMFGGYLFIVFFKIFKIIF